MLFYCCHRKVIVILFAFVQMQTAHGIISYGTAPSQRIVGGQHAVADEFPYQVLLSSGCGGSILSPVLILTAAHCVTKTDTIEVMDFLKVVAGTNDLTCLRSGSHQNRSARHIYIHENYEDETNFNDIALVVLSSPLHYSSSVASINLPVANEEFEGHALVSGWGATQEGAEEPSYLLRKVWVPLVSHLECSGWYEEGKVVVTENMLCAGEAGRDSCQGDSGGAAICRRKRPYSSKSRVQCGIVSQGIGCSRDRFAGIYTKVSKYIDWIKDTRATIFARDHKCRTDHFYCPSSGCIHRTYLCDNQTHCPDEDGKDERGCNLINIPYSYCLSNEFRCNNGKCIESKLRCDYNDDCDDGSDEDRCPTENGTCEEGEYPCGIDGRCIPNKWKCDGILDCDDNSDEDNCPTSLLAQKLTNLDLLAESMKIARSRAREHVLAILRDEESNEIRALAAETGSSSTATATTLWWTKLKGQENIHDVICKQWHDREPSSPTDTLVCPPTLAQAEADWRFYKDTTTEFSSQAMNPHSYSIYLQNVPSPSGAGSQCSYDSDGDLVIGYPHGSRMHRSSPNTFNGSNWDDVEPYYECCERSYKKEQNCPKYYFAKRPSPNIDALYISTVPFRASGATHVTTLDGATYLLNTAGTFLLLKYEDRLEIQVSTEPFEGPNASYGSTVITSAKIKSMNDNKVESTFHLTANRTSGLLIRLDDQPVNWNEHTGESFTKYHDGVTVTINASSQALFSYLSGFSIKMFLSEGNKSINIIGSTSFTSWGNVTGLVGKFGTNKNSDKMSKSFVPHHSTLDKISQDFVEQWKLAKYEPLFPSPTKMRVYSASHFSRDYLLSLAPDYVQIFCGNVDDCLIDYQLTGDREFAASSMSAYHQFEKLLNVSKIKIEPISCGEPSFPKNGKYLADNYSLGARITPTCQSGFYLTVKNKLVNTTSVEQEISFICRLNIEDVGDIPNHKITSYRPTWISSSQLPQPLYNYSVECISFNEGKVLASPNVVSILGNESLSLSLPSRIDKTDVVDVSCVFLTGAKDRNFVETEGTFLQGSINDTNQVVNCLVPALQTLGKVNIKLVIKYLKKLPLVLEGHVWSQKHLEDFSRILYLSFTNESKQIATLSWNPTTFGANTSSNCNFKLIIVQKSDMFWAEIGVLASNICNTGRYNVSSLSIFTSLREHVSTFQELFDIPTLVALKSDNASDTSKFASLGFLPSIVMLHNAIETSTASPTNSTGQDTNLTKYQEDNTKTEMPDFDLKCKEWYEKDEVEISLAGVLPCPSSALLAIIDWRFHSLSSESSYQFIQNVISQETNGAGSECVYNERGNLMVGSPAGSRIHRYSLNGRDNSWWNNYIHDTLPYLYCCRWSKANEENCPKYFYNKMGIHSQEGYKPPKFAHIWGAAHFQTFDGFKYRFNGAGEYWLVKAHEEEDHNENRFNCQMRLEPYSTGNTTNDPLVPNDEYNAANVSVVTAVAMEQNMNGNKVTIQVSKNVSKDFQVFVDGELLDANELKTLYHKGVKVLFRGNNSETCYVVFQNGFSFELKTNGVGEPGMSIIVSSAVNNAVIVGLLGNLDGNSSNDLSTPSGSILAEDASNLVIHTNFGTEWLVDQNDSIFTYYPRGSSWQDFYKPDYQPVEENFKPTFYKLIKYCNDDTDCLFDALETGSETFAEASKASKLDFQMYFHPYYKRKVL